MSGRGMGAVIVDETASELERLKSLNTKTTDYLDDILFILDTWENQSNPIFAVRQIISKAKAGQPISQRSVELTPPPCERERKIVKELRELIKSYAKARTEFIENYLAIYLTRTGLDVEDIELVEEQSKDGMKIIWYCRKRTTPR